MVHEQAAAYALDALDPHEVLEFERHLRSCPDCEGSLEPLRATATALAFAGELPLPRPELRIRVLDVGGGTVIQFRRRWALPLASAGAVAAACAAIVVGLRVWAEPAASSVAGLHPYALQAQASELARNAGGVLLVSDSREAVLVARGLPSPAPGTVYELWVVRRGKALPAGFLQGRVGPVTRLVLPGAAVAVSIEPSGGSRRPTGPLLLRAETA